MSTVQAGDVIAVYRGGQLHNAPADMSTVQDTDLIVVGRGNVPYKCTFADWKASQSKAPVINTVTLADSPKAGRFTSGTFATTVTMTEDGVPASTKGLKAWVEGTLKKRLVATAITATTGGSTPTLTFSTDQDLASFSAGDSVKQDPQKFQSGWSVVAPSAATDQARAIVAADDGTLFVGVLTGDILESKVGPVANWQKKTSPGAGIYGLGYHAGVLFVILSGKLWYSTDEAATWQENTAASASLAGTNPQFNQAAFVSGHYLFATSKGVYSTTDIKNGALTQLTTADTLGIASDGTRAIWCQNSPATTLVHYTDDGTTVGSFPVGATVGAYGIAHKGSDWYLVGASGLNAYAGHSTNQGATWAEINTSAIGSGGLYGCGIAKDGSFVTSHSSGVWGYKTGAWTKVLTGTGIAWKYASSKDVICGIAAGDKLIREGVMLPYGTVGSVNATAKTMTLSFSDGTWDAGASVVGPTKTIASAKLYIVHDASGAVSDLQSADPGYVTMTGSSPYTLTFPATLPSGNPPDTDLPAGTTLTAEVKASNNAGTSDKKSTPITPA